MYIMNYDHIYLPFHPFSFPTYPSHHDILIAFFISFRIISDDPLSPVSATHSSMDVETVEHGKPAGGHILHKERWSLPQLLSIARSASVGAGPEDHLQRS